MLVFTIAFLTVPSDLRINTTSSRSLEEAAFVLSLGLSPLSAFSDSFFTLVTWLLLSDFFSRVVTALIGTDRTFWCVFVWISALALIPGLNGKLFGRLGSIRSL